MNALELKQKLKNADNHLTLLKIFGLSVLLSCVVFPINYLVNPNIDPIIHEQPILLAFGFVAFIMMFAILIVGGLLTTLISLETYLLVSPRVADGYWNVASKLILRERFKKNTAEGIWDYVKLHRKHDPLYQADLEKINTKIDDNGKQHQKDMEIILREIRIKNHALNKVRSLKNQAERERDEAIRERDNTKKALDKVSYELRQSLTIIFLLDDIIRMKDRIIEKLINRIKKSKGD